MDGYAGLCLGSVHLGTYSLLLLFLSLHGRAVFLVRTLICTFVLLVSSSFLEYFCFVSSLERGRTVGSAFGSSWIVRLTGGDGSAFRIYPHRARRDSVEESPKRAVSWDARLPWLP